jgi:MFS family permease
MPALPLRRNRDFVLLQGGQLLSSAGSEATAIAYPLLVLALTGSAADAGLVTFARVLPFALFGLVAGIAADRYDRRRVMLGADVVRAFAVAGLGVAALADGLALWLVVLVAFVEGSGSAFFAPAAAGALRSVVPVRQLADAAGVQLSRLAAVRVAGPPVGGALFALGRAVPFLVDAVSYLFSVVALLLVRTPFQEAREPPASSADHLVASLRGRVAEGFRFLWRQPFLRTSTFLYGLTNFIGPGLLLTIVVLAEREGLGGGRIGLLLALFAAFVFLGSLVSGYARRALSVRTILLLELWMWLGCGAFLAWPDVYLLVASMLPAALAIPITDSVVIGHRLAVTPDRLVGRVESVRSTIALLVAPLGPLVAGLLLSSVSSRAAVGVFFGVAVVLVVWGMASRAIREAPRLDDIAAAGS